MTDYVNDKEERARLEPKQQEQAGANDAWLVRLAFVIVALAWCSLPFWGL